MITCSLVDPDQAYSLNPTLPVWFHPVWMRGIAALHKIRAQTLVCWRNDNPCAFLPLYEKRFISLKKAYNPVLVYYSPLFFALPARKQPNRELLQQYEISKKACEFLAGQYHRISLNLCPRNLDIRGFRENGFRAVPHYTFIKDLSQQGDFFIGEMAKLRNARQAGYIFSRGFEPGRLLDLVFQMNTRKSHPFPFGRASLLGLLGDLHAAGLIEQHNVKLEDRTVSSILIIEGKGDTCYGWMTAAEPDDMRKGAAVLQFWELFQTLSGRYAFLDLCGANSKGPSRLKAALAADLKLFFQILK